MTRSWWSATVVALALAACAALPGLAVADEQPDRDLQERLDAFVGLVPGGAAAITVHDGVTSVATSGILDDEGGPVAPETPFLLGPLGAPMTAVVVLQLVDDGRIELDERVKAYLPDAPVADGATVRHLLDWRAGIPDTYGQLIDRTLRDLRRGWSRQEQADLIDPEVVGTAGELQWSIGHETVAELLVEAVEDKDFGAVLSERIGEPLGLTSTVDIERDERLPPGTAAGWELDLGLAGDSQRELAGLQTLDGRASSVTDMATFLRALAAGELLSTVSTDVVFDESAVSFGMGFDTHEAGLGHLGDLGTRYYLSNGNLISGYSGSLAVSPETGDLVVVLTSNDDLPTWEFLHQTVSAWATEPE
ncbi:MAG: serine hydrolase domain-containing protein [Candidatus Limnocylindrales bacterium]